MAKKIFETIQTASADMIDDDRERDTDLFDEVDKHWRSEDELPKSLKDLQWIRAVKSNDPHDELLAATRMFANKKEIIKFCPYDDSVKTHAVANKIEKALSWNMHQCNRRRKISVRWDFVLSSLKYNAIAAQLDYLPYKQKIKGIKSPHQKAMASFGDFNPILHHPRYVHASFSDGMLERVVTNRTVETQKMIDFWGKDKIKFTGDSIPDEITVYDFTGYVDGKLKRGVWFSNSADDVIGTKIIDPDTSDGDLDIDFIPWIISFGGTTLETDPRHLYNPLLYAVINSGQWHTQNIAKTLVLSEAISHAAAPRYSVSGPGAEEVVIDYGDPSGKIVLPPGVTANPMPPPAMDQALMQIAQMFTGEMDKSTVSGLIQGSSGLGGNAAFSTWNLVLQHNLSSILQYKEQSEFALAEFYTMMLLWPHSQGKELKGYGMENKDRGKSYVVTPQDFKPEDVHIEVELIPDLPTNRGQQANTAVMLHREFPIPAERLMEELGYSDPEGMMKKWYFERKLTALQSASERQKMGEVELALQIQGQQAMTAMQPQQQQQPQAPSGPTQQQAPAAGKPPGFEEQLQGEGMNPAEGGTPPQEFYPEGTRENQTGETADGQNVEEG
jgi:hypothetical protein